MFLSIRCVLSAGHAVELELAVASVMGSGLFIVCVSLAGVLFVKGVGITDRCLDDDCTIGAWLHLSAHCPVVPWHPEQPVAY